MSRFVVVKELLNSPMRAIALHLTAGTAPAPGATADTALVERAREGDRDAEDLLYRAHARRLLGMLTRLTGSTADADDLLHDTFDIAFNNLGRLRDASSFASWLTGIAVNKARHLIRKRSLARKFRLWFGEQDAKLSQLASPECSPEIRAELARIQELLDQMPVKNREAWILRHVEGFTLPEVAELARCSLATAKRRIAAAQAPIAAHVGAEVLSDE